MTDPVCWISDFIGIPMRKQNTACPNSSIWLVCCTGSPGLQQMSELKKTQVLVTGMGMSEKSQRHQKSLNPWTPPSPKSSQLDKCDDSFKYKAKLEMQQGSFQARTAEAPPMHQVKYQRQSKARKEKCCPQGACIPASCCRRERDN